jgi:glycosyltransferase involved in cell wall biosynthesis
LKLDLIVPGSINQITGGYVFARRIVWELRAHGDHVSVVELDGRFPDADAAAKRAATAALAALPNGATAVIDGLALLGFADCLADEAQRLKLVGFVHHSLADETGLSARKTGRFLAAEQRLLPLLRGIVCPSRNTAAALFNHGIPEERIAVTPPGTSKSVAGRRRDKFHRQLRLLTVATITPRKGHRVLIEALASIDRTLWRLDCIGSLTRDPDCVAELRDAIVTHGLETNIRLLGERPPAQLMPAYDDADLFVLPSFHEGYGMAFAEAMAHGLPIVATTAGAIPDTVPTNAAVLVPPGDIPALIAALDRVTRDHAFLTQLSDGARRAAAELPDWPEAVAHWREAVVRFIG